MFKKFFFTTFILLPFGYLAILYGYLNYGRVWAAQFANYPSSSYVYYVNKNNFNLEGEGLDNQNKNRKYYKIVDGKLELAYIEDSEEYLNALQKRVLSESFVIPSTAQLFLHDIDLNISQSISLDKLQQLELHSQEYNQERYIFESDYTEKGVDYYIFTKPFFIKKQNLATQSNNSDSTVRFISWVK